MKKPKHPDNKETALKIIEALSQGMTYKEVADGLEVSRTTFYRMRNSPEYKKIKALVLSEGIRLSIGDVPDE